MSPRQRELYDSSPHVPEITERERLLAGGGSASDLSGDDLLQPRPNERSSKHYQSKDDAEVTDYEDGDT